jgi:hypothetical protein
MGATLIDANGRIFEVEVLDLSRPLAEQRPDLVDVTMPATVVYTSAPAPVAPVWKTSTTETIRGLVRAPSAWVPFSDVVAPAKAISPSIFAPTPSPYRWPAADRPGARKQRRGR